MTRYRHIEDDHQKAYFDWVRSMSVQDYRRYGSIIAIPNGGRRDVREAARLKAQGVKPGVSDIFIAFPAGGFHGCWIELKRPKVKNQSMPVVSADQMEWLKRQTGFGYLATVCYGWDSARKTTEAYFAGDGE